MPNAYFAKVRGRKAKAQEIREWFEMGLIREAEMNARIADLYR